VDFTQNFHVALPCAKAFVDLVLKISLIGRLFWEKRWSAEAMTTVPGNKHHVNKLCNIEILSLATAGERLS
jgi:hypothetical protein